MICLGIESTAHTFGASVVTSKRKILSDIRDMYKKEKGGIIPNEAAQHHELICRKVIREAIEKANVEKIDLVSYSRGPGLGPCLQVGIKSAKEIAKDLNAELIGVNHAIAHLTSGHLFTKANDPIYLYLSGANTQIIALEGKRFRIFGETLDIALGNALDKFGRIIGLGFPAGLKIEELAKLGKYIELPYVVKGMDISLAGLITKIEDLSKKGIKKEDLCYSLQETAFAMITEVTERALAHTGKKEVLLIGGVAANKRLCEMLNIMCKDRGADFFVVPLEYCGDQGTMIGWQGILERKGGRIEKNHDIRPYERVDDVEVIW